MTENNLNKLVDFLKHGTFDFEQKHFKFYFVGKRTNVFIMYIAYNESLEISK